MLITVIFEASESSKEMIFELGKKVLKPNDIRHDNSILESFSGLPCKRGPFCFS